MSLLGFLFWVIFLLIMFTPYFRRNLLNSQRFALIRFIEKKRNSRVITIIHRQETVSILGFPIARYLSIEDSEMALRAIRMTPEDMPIDIILHTPGGLVLASEQIACALKRHKGKVTAFIPHYAMSGGTLIALAADEIIMDPDAVLGPVDPQLGIQSGGYYPAASILKAIEQPNPNRDDTLLVLGDMARKAIKQVHDLVYNLLTENHTPEKAEEIATMLSEGRWTHDYPITVELAKDMGLPVRTDMPTEIYKLMDLYPQSAQARPSVEYIPTPYTPPTRPSRTRETK